MSQTRILLASNDVAYEQRIRQAFKGGLNGDLRRHYADAPDAGLGAGGLDDDTLRVVAVGPGMGVDRALEVARMLDRDRPEISVVVVADPSPALWEQALRAGVRDVLSPEASDAELRETFERALETAERRWSNLVGAPDDADGGRVITVLSPKGGSGKTTVATNLAVGLATAAPGRVVLVDFDLQFGDVSSALRLVPEHTTADAVRVGGALDVMTLKTFLTPHPSELYVLAAPELPEEGDSVGAEFAAHLLRLLAAEFDHVIVDTCAGLTEHSLAALEVSTDLLLLCAMDVPSVRGLRKEIAALDQLGFVTQRRHLVLNRAGSRVGLATDDVEATIGLPIDVAIPSSRGIPLSVNQGSPLLVSEPRSPAGKQLSRLVERFVPEQAVAPRAGRSLLRMGSR